MIALFDQRSAPPTFEFEHIFESDGSLRRDVFLRAWSHVNQTSTPGFPFLDLSLNSDVPLNVLYCEVSSLLKRWESDSFPTSRADAFQMGFAPPAHLFVKGEPTKVDKRARLIYGVSVVMNVIARIFFGDYLDAVKQTWHTASHKVGLDFNTREGLDMLDKNVRLLSRAKAMLWGVDVVSDDIQGWEYQSRTWMHLTWHDAYLNKARATPLHRKLQLAFANAEMLAYVVDSDGWFHDLPFYITMSGRVTTHLQNSDERAALSIADFAASVSSPSGLAPDLLTRYMLSITNGDDCVMLKAGGTFASETLLGFVHTDVRVEDPLGVWHFCSQEFYRDDEGRLQRRPESIVKTMYNILTADSQHAVNDSLLYCVNHPSFSSIVACVTFDSAVVLSDGK